MKNAHTMSHLQRMVTILFLLLLVIPLDALAQRRPGGNNQNNQPPPATSDLTLLRTTFHALYFSMIPVPSGFDPSAYNLEIASRTTCSVEDGVAAPDCFTDANWLSHVSRTVQIAQSGVEVSYGLQNLQISTRYFVAARLVDKQGVRGPISAVLIADTRTLPDQRPWTFDAFPVTVKWSSQNCSFGYDDVGSPVLAYGASGDEVRIARRNSAGWSTSRVEAGTDVGVSISLSMNDNAPAVTYGRTPLRYAEEQAGSWSFATVDPLRRTSVSWTSLAISPANGQPVVSYQSGAGQMIGFRQDGRWNTENLDPTASGNFSTISFEPNTRSLALAYAIRDPGGENLHTQLQYVVRGEEGWTRETIDSGYLVGTPSLAHHPVSGDPFILYNGRGDDGLADLRLAWRQGNEWHITRIAEGYMAGAGLAFDPDGYMYLLYGVDSRYLLVAHGPDPENLTTELVIAGNQGPPRSFMRVSPSGTPQICYLDTAAGEMRFLTRSDEAATLAGPVANANEPNMESEEIRVFGLSEGYPNPFNPVTTFTLAVDSDQAVKVEVFDVVGRRVATLFDGSVQPNRSIEIRLDAGSLPSGLYLVRARGETFSSTRRVQLIK
jgi:hypothetical protein